MIKVCVIGATGYVGSELVRLLAAHPHAELTSVVSESYQGRKLREIYPHLHGFGDMVCDPLQIDVLANKADLFFLALPHGVSMDVADGLLKLGKTVIDLGADYRINDLAVYEKWYGPHKTPELLSRAVYGIAELNRENIAGAKLLANPGCYPTTALLGLAPALKNGLIALDHIVIDSKSGVSGAGRKLNQATHFCDCTESTKAYNVGKHRHKPEIEQELTKLAGEKVRVTFTPHLVPLVRGMLSTIYTDLKPGISLAKVHEAYQEFYQDNYFVEVLPLGQLPETQFVAGSNFCNIGLALDEEQNQLIILSAIDNLLKGAAGQAVQNMNIMYGWPENTGLQYPGMYP